LRFTWSEGGRYQMAGKKGAMPEELARKAYFAGKISMEEYMASLKSSDWGDHTRREVQKSVRRILNKVNRLKAVQ